MLSVQQGLRDEGVTVPMTKLCQWFGVARRTTYYKPTKGRPRSMLSWQSPSRK